MPTQHESTGVKPTPRDVIRGCLTLAYQQGHSDARSGADFDAAVMSRHMTGQALWLYRNGFEDGAR